MTEENITPKKDPTGFSLIDLQKEHLETIDLLKSNSYPNVGFIQSTDPKEPENQLSFHFIKENMPFCVDTKLMTVCYQNKVENNIKAIFKT